MKALAISLLSILQLSTVLGGMTAREALQVFERQTSKATITQTVAIVGLHGSEQPHRWRFLALDPENENLLREYVLENNTVTGPKSIPRVAGQNLPRTPIFLAAMKLDSTDVYQMADDEAIEAGVSFAKVNYQLRWRGNDPEPTWLATLLSAENAAVGRVYIMAASGTVVHRDFQID
ncbi:MAG: hypothetical protein AAGH89_09430 [Verrucomicrobiota bacterium]